MCTEWVKVRSILVIAGSCELAGRRGAGVECNFAEKRGRPQRSPEPPETLF